MQDWLVVLLKAIVLYFLSFLLIRLMGPSNIARMTTFRLVNYIVIAIIVSLVSLNLVSNWEFGILTLGIWFVLTMALDYLSVKSKRVHDIVNGKSNILIDNGKIMEKNVSKARMTGEELLSLLRSKNAFNLADVEFAVMETNGEVNVLLKSDKKPVTPHDMGNPVAPRSQPQTVIMNGKIIDESLANIGLNRSWLNTEIEKLGVSLDNIFLGQADSSGDLYIDLFDDSLHIPKPKVKEMIYANLEKSHADLLSYALETEDKEMKKMYSDDAMLLDNTIEKLKPHLLH